MAITALSVKQQQRPGCKSVCLLCHVVVNRVSATTAVPQLSAWVGDSLAVMLNGMQVYSGLASEAAFIGKESPGPQAYDQHRSAMGRQVSLSCAACLMT